MDYVTGVQKLHYEARLPGSPPQSVTGQTGRAADLVRWYADAWGDVQRERDGKWKWLKGRFIVDTVASTQEYGSSDCTDLETGDDIARFRGWVLEKANPPFIYRVSDGVTKQSELGLADWERFRRTYIRATPTPAAPTYITADEHNSLWLGPNPDDVYRVTGEYWKSNQTLAANDDEPECPEDYHMLIVYRALTKYGYDQVAQEILSKAAFEGQALYNALSENQGYSRFRLKLCGPLA